MNVNEFCIENQVAIVRVWTTSATPEQAASKLACGLPVLLAAVELMRQAGVRLKEMAPPVKEMNNNIVFPTPAIIAATVETDTSPAEAADNRRRLASPPRPTTKLAPMTEAEQQAVARYWSLTVKVAACLARRNPYVRQYGVDEAASLGVEGLLYSIRSGKYDPTKGSFEGYAFFHIRNAIVTGVQAWVGKNGRNVGHADVERCTVAGPQAAPDLLLMAEETVAEQLRETGGAEPGTFNDLKRKARELGLPSVSSESKAELRRRVQAEQERAAASEPSEVIPAGHNRLKAYQPSPDEVFVRAWMSCTTVSEVAARLGQPVSQVRKTARWMRTEGVRLPYLGDERRPYLRAFDSACNPSAN